MTPAMVAVRSSLVVGAGLAGLGASIALARQGVAVRVIEERHAPASTSVAVTQRAVYALAELGVLEDAMACGLVLRGRPPLRGDTRLPQAVMLHRPELVRILREEAERHGAMIELGVTALELTQDAEAVTVRSSDGKCEQFELVVGADGIHSRIRAIIHPDLKPTYQGHTTFRWLAHVDVQPPVGYHFAGEGRFVMIGRLPERVTHCAVGVDMEQRQIAPPEARAIVAAALEQLEEPAFGQLKAALDDNAQILVRPVEALLAPPPWQRGRVALIGHAAHASAPPLSANAALALEDACVLGQELARADQVRGALDAFMARRGPRTREVSEAVANLFALQRAHADMDAVAEARGTAVQVLAAPY
jgi:2-polyprenyl-6-methoxyphenol hydroxylase-like FAD-dependent oxidoreductase